MIKPFMSKRIFIDTSAWIMLLNKSESGHQEAVRIYENLNRIGLITSNLIIGETYTWLRIKTGFQAAFGFLQTISRKAELRQIEIIYANALLEQQATLTLEKYADQRFSYADAVSFCIMQNLKIKKAFAYDQHFITAGFQLVGGS
jgi:uncharacterized protein